MIRKFIDFLAWLFVITCMLSPFSLMVLLYYPQRIDEWLLITILVAAGFHQDSEH